MNVQKSDFGIISWYWVIHINICDVQSDGFWLCLETDAFKLLTWHVMVQVNSPATDLSVPPACWGMGIVGGGMMWSKVGQGAGSSAFNLSHISEGCWAVVYAGMAIPMFSLFV